MLRAIGLGILALTTSVLSYGQTPLTAKRDKALERIKACLRRNEVSSRECKHLNQDVGTLVEVYRGGDKSVLPDLFRFTYLTDFYDEALLSDPEGFLTVMSHLSQKEQQAVAVGIAGGMAGATFGLSDVHRFEAIRKLLASVPDASPTKAVADLSLKVVETRNASHLVNYFPPDAFTGPAARFRVGWYSSDMYRLGEKPLWPPSSANEKTFRFTHLGAWSDSKAVRLTILPDGSGEVKIAIHCTACEQEGSARPRAVPREGVLDFLTQLNHAHFWEMPTESSHSGFDGAEWILEGVEDGRYHIVVRWCPDLHEHSAEDKDFADTARSLFRLAGYKPSGSCGPS